MNPQIPPEDLIAYLDGELEGDAHERVERALRDDSALSAEADLLRRSGEMIRDLPRVEASSGFGDRVARATSAERAAPRGGLRRLFAVRYAAAAVLVLGVAGWWALTSGPAAEDAPYTLTAQETEDIARDLYVLSNLDVLKELDAAELASLVDDLDLLESVEAETTLLEEG